MHPDRNWEQKTTLTTRSRGILVQNDNTNCIFTYVFSSCQLVLLISSGDCKTLISSKSICPVWSAKVKPDPDRLLSQPVNFIQSQPEFSRQVAEAILILDPRSVTKPHWAVEAFLNYDPTSYRRGLVAIDWKRVVAICRLYNVDSVDFKSRFEKLLTVRVNWWIKCIFVTFILPSGKEAFSWLQG